MKKFQDGERDVWRISVRLHVTVDLCVLSPQSFVAGVDLASR